MAKIIIIASPDDKDSVERAKVLLEADGHDVVIEDPTPKALTDIMLGLMSKGGFGFGARWGYTQDKEDKPEKEEKPEDKEKPADKPEPEAVDVDVDIGESLGMVEVDGELMEAFRVNSEHTSVQLPYEIKAGKVSYQLNESQFAFWSISPTDLTTAMTITHDGISSSATLKVVRGDVAKLLVGRDLSGLYK